MTKDMLRITYFDSDGKEFMANIYFKPGKSRFENIKVCNSFFKMLMALARTLRQTGIPFFCDITQEVIYDEDRREEMSHIKSCSLKFNEDRLRSIHERMQP